MNRQPLTEPLMSFAAVVDQADVPLTRVMLAYIERRIDMHLRFGEPVQTLRLDCWRRVAIFQAGSVFCRVCRQECHLDCVRWQLMVMQACTPTDAPQRIPGVRPGAQLLLRAEGEAAVRAVLLQIDAIEARGIVLAAVSPVYWRTLGHRLAAYLPMPSYSAARHAAWLAARRKW